MQTLSSRRGRDLLRIGAGRDPQRHRRVPQIGATRLVDRFGLLDWPSRDQTPSSSRSERPNNSDPEGRRWPRGKRRDDASAAFCHLA
jgi:hypothetical protein